MFMADARLPSVRALILDLDGTLIDSKLDLIHSVNAMLGEMKRPRLAAETISGYIGHGAPQLVARALGGSATEEELKDALQFFLGYYEEHKMDNTCAYPGVQETLEQLSHMPMAVLTNKPERISVRILNSLGLATLAQTKSCRSLALRRAKLCSSAIPKWTYKRRATQARRPRQ